MIAINHPVISHNKIAVQIATLSLITHKITQERLPHLVRKASVGEILAARIAG